MNFSTTLPWNEQLFVYFITTLYPKAKLLHFWGKTLDTLLHNSTYFRALITGVRGLGWSGWDMFLDPAQLFGRNFCHLKQLLLNK